MRRIRLIAVREFTAYTATASFWVALLMGPLLIALAALAAGASAKPAPPHHVAVESADPALAAAGVRALQSAARIEGRALVASAPAEAATTLHLARDGETLTATVEGRPLPRTTAALLGRDLALSQAGAAPVAVRQPAPAPAKAADPHLAGRFAVVMLLWMTLVGALGMLLQAIVRERANRALEILLVSARPSEVILGKLAGVGAVSVVVLAAWMGAGAAVALLAGQAGGGAGPRALAAVFGLLRDPVAVAGAGAVYLCAFTMYGSALLGLGALARDLPAAQNLARPVFGVLLVVFFTVLSALKGGAPDWLIWAPPFTPFLLMLRDPATLSTVETVGASALLVASTLAVLALAPRGLKLDGGPVRWLGRLAAAR